MFTKNCKCLFVLSAFALVAAMSLANAAKAEIINSISYIKPTGVTASSEFPIDPRVAGNLIDASGINTTTGLANSPGITTTQWLSGYTDNPTLIFTLDKKYDLAKTHVWNAYYAGSDVYNWAYGAKGVTISTSEDGSNYSAGDHFTFAPAGDSDPGQDYALPTVAVGVQYVKFVMDSIPADNTYSPPNNAPNYTFAQTIGGDGGNNRQKYTGLQEVRFTPEPATMALLGLGGLGVLLRRKHR